ncbi:MAG: B12-binding domain-containing radical SAM protein [Thermoplasmata archaeon]|nr:MAG: B12-binding domain-containing radical SAM protein [Thermoplasmata archaeon]KAA0015799.1 MAG: B12-binding domain-containing radical SAM protein [Thermoplasmata archaeon]
MRILLIEPRLEHGIITYRDRLKPISIIYGNPSLTLPMVAAVTPKKHYVKILNENYEKLKITDEWDLVGISVLTITAKRAYEIADKFRELGVKVVLGGYHVSALPDEAKQHADAVVIGEAENLWPQLLEDLEKGKLKEKYFSNEKPDLSKIPNPRRDLYYNFLSGAAQATRGCPVGCDFCPTSKLLGRIVRKRPIKDVIEDIKSIPNKVIIFRDASLTLDIEYSKALFKAMRGLGKKWIANGNINVLGRDEEFLRLSKEAGCIQWFVGFESISKETLKKIHKMTNVNAVEKYGEYVRKIQKHGIAVVGGMIFGFDEDTPDVFETTYNALEEWQVDGIEFNILTPYPGTAIYERFEREGRILTKDWSKYSQAHVVFKPKRMTPEELLEGYMWITKKFYSMDKVLKRILHYFGYAKDYEKSPALLSLPTLNFAMRRYYKIERKRIRRELRDGTAIPSQ